MYCQDFYRVNTIAAEIELVLTKLQLAQANNHPDEVRMFTHTLETLLNQYMNLRQEQKLQSAI